MENISDLLKERANTKTKINSERAYVISLIVDEINKERPITYKVNGKKKTLGKITPRAVAIKVGHIKNTKDLYFLLSEGKDYKNRHKSFSKYFFGSLKCR